jgi:hypothetical protein
MKSLLLIMAVGCALAFSVNAQTTTTNDENKDKATEQSAPATTTEKAKPSTGANIRSDEGRPGAQPAERENNRMSGPENQREGVNMHADTRVHENANAGPAVRATTVFRSGREVHESLSLHRGMRETTDVHFRIGTHPREWWLRTYSIVLMEGCHYFLADNGCWYPAYGFDPACNYTPGVVYCE